MPTYVELIAAARKADAAGDGQGAKRLLELASQSNNQGQGPTIANAQQLEIERLQGGVSGERLPDVEQQMTTQARAHGAPPGMVYDSRTGQFVDTAAMAERMGQGATSTALMAIPGAGEFVDQAMGAVRGAVTGENPDIAAETMRQSRGQFREKHPIGAPALEIGAGLLASAPAVALAGPKMVAQAATSLGGRVSQAAAIGGGGGAVEGALSGYGAADYGGRVQGAKEGALFGGLVGAGFGAAGSLTAAGIGKAWRRIQDGAAPAAPTTEALRAAKSQAYKVVDDSGFVASADEFDGAFSGIVRGLDDMDYNPDADPQIRAVLKALENRWGDDISLGQIDRLRQLTWRRVKGASTDQERALASVVIDGLDNLIDNMGAGAQMDAARQANAQFRKAQAFEAAWDKLERQTAGTGSGGNILNKSIQAVNRIIDGPDARFFSKDELDLMRAFVDGDASRNILRRIGKLAPGGNGLMSALNLGAVAANPAMLGVTAAATGAKAVSDRSAVRGFGELRDAMATGVTVKPAVGTALTAPTSAALGAVGSATRQQGPTTARERGLEIYNQGVTDPTEIKAILSREGFL